MKKKLKKIVDSQLFQNLIAGVIILDGIILIVESFSIFNSKYNYISNFLLNLILAILIIDCLLRITAEGLTFWRYFYNVWNSIDAFIIFSLLVFSNNKYIVFIRIPRLLKSSRFLRGLGIVKTISQNFQHWRRKDF